MTGSDVPFLFCIQHNKLAVMQCVPTFYPPSCSTSQIENAVFALCALQHFVMCEPCGPAMWARRNLALMCDASGKLEIGMHSRGYGLTPLRSIWEKSVSRWQQGCDPWPIVSVKSQVQGLFFDNAVEKRNSTSLLVMIGYADVDLKMLFLMISQSHYITFYCGLMAFNQYFIHQK